MLDDNPQTWRIQPIENLPRWLVKNNVESIDIKTYRADAVTTPHCLHSSSQALSALYSNTANVQKEIPQIW